MKYRKIPKIITIVFSSIAGISILIAAIWCIAYPAILRISHKISAPGIDLMENVEIGGIKQTVHFRGKDIENPVMLVLHGGPGFPMNLLMHGYQYDWETDFTIVNWDQRQAGRTYVMNNPDEILEALNIERILADAHEMTQYIKQKLGKEKIIIMGFSWGSMIGTMLVQMHPEDYSAYIGVGQIISGQDGWRVIYDKVLEMARTTGNQDNVTALEAFAPFPSTDHVEHSEAIKYFRQYLRKYKLPSGISIPRLVIEFGITSPYYKLGEPLRFMTGRAMNDYNAPLHHFMQEEFDARSFGIGYEIPVYYIMGMNDWQTPYHAVKEFFTEIFAPDKSFYFIPDAGHWTMIDNKTEFTRVLLQEIKPRINFLR